MKKEPAVLVGLCVSVALAVSEALSASHSVKEFIVAFIPLACGVVTRHFVSPAK